MATLDVELVSASRLVWRGEARSVRARTLAGELGVLPGHQPLLGALANGEVIIHTIDSGDHTLKVEGGGFLSVDHDRVTIIAEQVDSAPVTA